MSRYSVKLGLAALLFSGCLTALAAEPPVEVAKAEDQQVNRGQIFDGVVEAVNKSTVSAQTSGRVVELNYDVGDVVPKGSVLVRLRDQEQRARFERAKAGLTEARAQLANARDEYERIKGVYERDMASQSEMDQAKAQLDTGKAQVEQAEAALHEAEEQLDYTRIRAPYAGVVSERHVEIGETVNPGHKLMTGISLDELRVNVYVPQRHFNSVRKHRQVEVYTDDGRALDVTDLTFYPYAESASHSFKVRVYLPKGTEDLYPGMFVKVGMRTGQYSHLVIPAEAVAYRSEVTGVYVVDDQQRLRFRQIRVGEQTDTGMIEVLAGLEAGERVATDPVQAALVYKQTVAKRTEAVDHE